VVKDDILRHEPSMGRVINHIADNCNSALSILYTKIQAFALTMPRFVWILLSLTYRFMNESRFKMRTTLGGIATETGETFIYSIF